MQFIFVEEYQRHSAFWYLDMSGLVYMLGKGWKNYSFYFIVQKHHKIMDTVFQTRIILIRIGR